MRVNSVLTVEYQTIQNADPRRNFEKLGSSFSPASALAVPTDMAKVQVSQALQAGTQNLMLGLPTSDNIFAIGSVAVKSSPAVRSALNLLGVSAWGF